MKVKGTPVTLDDELGSAGDVELAVLMVPMSTYQLILEHARKESRTVAEVFSAAIIGYINHQNAPVVPTPKPTPDFVVRRKK